jgi:hypothetical protein
MQMCIAVLQIVLGLPPLLNPFFFSPQPFLINSCHFSQFLEKKSIMESLVKDFEGLEISKSVLYKFMTAKCCVCIKQSQYHSVQRNSPEKLQKRFDWVTNWQKTNMDYATNCVFIDEAAFHINLKRGFS